ncbi:MULTISPECIES: site-specific DNA-methyltransferase [Prevotella]|uniref:DNA-methyltransferase n=1 Tax=Prevotella TaxID=838 RepID=UPI0028DBFB70|nr:site-specific DNA-methyltransferase [Prevotella pallens]
MIELNHIYNEDCLEGMKRIPDNSVDLVCTDPPYCIGTTSNGKKGSWNDNNLIKPFFNAYFGELERVCKDNAQLYLNTDWRTYPFLYPIIQNFFDVKNLIVWDYEWIKAGSHYRFSHEFIIYAVKGNAKRTFSASERDVWRIRPINFTSKEKLHNAQKPLELLDKMILNSSKEGDVVLDTFIGSGTTAISCLNNKRNFIGFEIDENYFNIAIKRIKERELNLDL